ncbi:hypothetical protein RIR_jg38869.t1 [Rhizophagus irregularis DAOM 181602=DAOM 197198]|nr:hypothetical protein RIR_jg38869.t1 [Rhizophagus irregularis DAOM 181602=DAOM 197198]
MAGFRRLFNSLDTRDGSSFRAFDTLNSVDGHVPGRVLSRWFFWISLDIGIFGGSFDAKFRHFFGSLGCGILTNGNRLRKSAPTWASYSQRNRLRLGTRSKIRNQWQVATDSQDS